MMRSHIAVVVIAMLSVSLPACVVSPQKIDVDSDHWVRFAFTEGSNSIIIRVPPDSYSPPFNHFPEPAFSRINRRQLLGMGWDYNSRVYVAEFQILAILVHLQDSLSESRLNAETVDAAIRAADHRPIVTDGTHPTRLKTEQIAGRTWFHNDAREYGDSYYARVDDRTLLWIDASYWDAIRAHPDWLASRKAIARAIVETVDITPSSGRID